MNQRGGTELKVGIAVSLGLILLIITVFLLGDQSIFSSTYILKAKFDKVDGLAPGSVVRLSGYQVGNVSEIEFDPNDTKLVVHMEVLKKYQERINSSSVAGLRTQGALGDKYVYIQQGADNNNEFLKDGDFINPETSSDLFSTLTSRAQEVEKIFDILSELHKFTLQLNQDGRSDKLMKNLVSATQKMDSAMEQLDAALKDIRGEDGKNLKKVGKALASVSEKLDNGSGTLGALINDPTIHDRMKSVLGGSQRNEYMKSLIQQTIQEGKN